MTEAFIVQASRRLLGVSSALQIRFGMRGLQNCPQLSPSLKVESSMGCLAKVFAPATQPYQKGGALTCNYGSISLLTANGHAPAVASEWCAV